MYINWKGLRSDKWPVLNNIAVAIDIFVNSTEFVPCFTIKTSAIIETLPISTNEPVNMKLYIRRMWGALYFPFQN